MLLLDQNRAVSMLKIVRYFSTFVLVGLSFWLTCTSAIAKGDGIKVGSSGQFHPRLFINGGYDSNVFHRSHQTPANAAVPESIVLGAPFLSVRPGLELNIDTTSVGFYLGGFANYSHYFVGNSLTSNLNTITAKADLELHFLRDKPFSFSIFNNFSRNTGDSFTAADIFNRTIFYYQAGTQNGAVYITHNNISRLLLTFKPGGGALSFDVGYSFAFAFYPSDQLDNNTHKFTVGAKWNFFPRTAFTFDGEFNVVTFSPRMNLGLTSSVNNNMLPFKAYLGLVGQLTERILLTLRVGGGYTLVNGTSAAALNDNWGMVIGNVDLTYKISLTTYFRVGFRHDFHPSVFTNYYHETIGYAEFGTQFGPITRPFVFNIHLDGGFIGFGKISQALGTGTFNGTANPDGTFSRGDGLFRASSNFDWHIYKFWMIGLLARFEFRNSNLFVVTNGNQLGLGYIKFEIMFNTELAF